MVRCCCHSSVRGSNSSESLGTHDQPKKGFLKALASWAVALLLKGNDLPTILLFSLDGEVLGGCHKGLLPPPVNSFLHRNEVWDMEELASLPMIMFLKKYTANPLKELCWFEPPWSLLGGQIEENGKRQRVEKNQPPQSSWRHLKSVLKMKNKHTFQPASHLW